MHEEAYASGHPEAPLAKAARAFRDAVADVFESWEDEHERSACLSRPTDLTDAHRLFVLAFKAEDVAERLDALRATGA